MHAVAKHFKDKVRLFTRMLHEKEQNMLTQQMNSMFSDMMRSAAAADAQQRQLQQRLMGR